MNDKPLQKNEAPQQTLLGTIIQTVGQAGDAASDVARKGSQIGEQLAQSAVQTTQTAISYLQRTLGEDYYAILAENPLILDTLSRSNLLMDNQLLLSTAFNLPWTTALFWGTASGATISYQRQITTVLQEYFHDAPGHIYLWKEINAYIDSSRGKYHRLKFGHSIDYLPRIVERFGVKGIPAFFMHLVQDCATVDGIPIIPKAWEVKGALELAAIPKKIAVGLVSLNYSSLLGALSVVTFVNELWKFGEALIKKAKTQHHLKTATAAIQNHDYNAAIENYQRALEVERSPFVMMALGQVYMRRPSTRLRAHRAFIDAVSLLADRPDATGLYGQARLSIRGIAGVQALSTADVLADIHPEHWNDHVQDLVNATVFSFASAASRQSAQSESLVPDMIATSAHFSAAINFYLAAKSASYYPFIEERREKVLRNLEAAQRSLGMVAQYDEKKLRPSAKEISNLWDMELLPSNEIEAALAGY
jgi:hypothetical protein